MLKLFRNISNGLIPTPRTSFFHLCGACVCAVLISSCTANTDPNEAGLFGSVYHMSKGTYKSQNEKKRHELQQLKQRQQQQQKELQGLDTQLRQQQYALTRAEKSLQVNQQQLLQKQKVLQGTKTHYAAQGKQRNELRKQSNKLDTQIKIGHSQIKKQTAHIRTLKTKRDALRKELSLQSSL